MSFHSPPSITGRPWWSAWSSCLGVALQGGSSSVATILWVSSWSYVACWGLGGLVVRPPRRWRLFQRRWSSRREPCSHRPGRWTATLLGGKTTGSFFFFFSPILPSADIVRGLRYLPGLLHPVELDRDLREGGSLIGTVPPALLHQLITGQGKTCGWVLNTAGKKDLITKSGIKSWILTPHHHSFWVSPSCSLGAVFHRALHMSCHNTVCHLGKKKQKHLIVKIVFESISSYLEFLNFWEQNFLFYSRCKSLVCN